MANFTAAPRALMPDYLRLAALFGIAVVNVQFMAFSALGDFASPPAEGLRDALTMWLVNGLALFKTFGLFSFMFGVGLGLMMQSAERRGLSFGRTHRNRMIGLLILGVAHGCLFFPGDILTVYALTGGILYLLRGWTIGGLVRAGAVLLIVQGCVAPLLLLAAPEASAETLRHERAILTQGGFLEVVAFRSLAFALALPPLLFMQGIGALGWFCLGLAAVRAGAIDDAAHPVWAGLRRWCLPAGVALGLIGAAMWQWGPTAPGVALTVATAPLATMGYLGVIAALARPPGPIMARVLAAGGSSLSVYLGQSMVMSTVFAGYGLGLWGRPDRLTATAIAIIATAALILALALWRARFALGPFEWVLRRITYAGQRG